MDNGDRMNPANIVKKYRAYVTNLGLSGKEKQHKISRSNRGTISFGEAMAGGL